MKGRPIVQGSKRSTILAELSQHPEGAMAADMSAWTGISIVVVRKALESLIAGGDAIAVPEHCRGGGGKPTRRFFHVSLIPASPQPPTAPPRPEGQVAAARVGVMHPERVEWRQIGDQLVKVTIGACAVEPAAMVLGGPARVRVQRESQWGAL